MGDDRTVETHANERTDTETEAMTDFLEFAGRRARVISAERAKKKATVSRLQWE